jgi:hypothetical protein
MRKTEGRTRTIISWMQESFCLIKRGIPLHPDKRFVYLMKEFWSGFRRDADENCAVLGYYAARTSNSLQTFRNNLSVPSSRH